MWCFYHFDFKICFASQRRAFFEQLNFQKCSDTDVICSFWLPNVLHATVACTFSTSHFPKCSETEVFLSFFTSKCALRHSGAQFLISYPARRLRTRHFITLIYLDLLSSDSFSSLPAHPTVLSPLLHAATASGSLTSKLPSISPLAHPEQALLIFAVLDNLAPLLLEACSIPMLHWRLNRKNQLPGRD